MKRKVIAAVLLIVLLVALFLFAVPRYYFDSEAEISIRHVEYLQADGNVDMTDAIDLDYLEEVLHLMRVGRIPGSMGGYNYEAVTYTIDGTCDGEPFHILLGDGNRNQLYVSADQGGYGIRNSDVWMGIMRNLHQKGNQ